MNIRAAAAYAAHLLAARSTAGHGVHSPLLFRFITEVIGGRTDKEIIAEVRRLKREMLSDKRVVRITDLGAGSTVMGRKKGSFIRDASAPALYSESEGETGSNTRPAGPETGPGTVSSDGITSKPFVIERRISKIAAMAALPVREAALMARIAASLDAILGRVPGQQAGGSRADKQQTGDSQVPGRIAGDLQTPGRMAGDTPETGWTVKDLPVTDYPAGDLSLSDLQGSGLQSGHGTADSQNISGKTPGEILVPGLPGNSQPENKPGKALSGESSQPDTRPVILELGTSLGISTLALALGAPQKRIITVEGCPELAAIARENLSRHGAENAEVLNMEFSQALSHLKRLGTKVEMAFIDGNHRGRALIEYAHRIMEMGDELIIVADDIHLNSDMIRAWKTLCKDEHTSRPDVSTGAHTGQRQASLETFRLGILFCLQNLTPGHYRVRY